MRLGGSRKKLGTLTLLGRGFLVVIALTSALVAISFNRLKNSTLPQISGDIGFGSSKPKVEIIRDQYGIPHIRAKTDEDAFFALGFVHWQDRAWQMDFQRRVVQGRLSEVLGKAALSKDKFLRTWGFYRSAQSIIPALSPRSRKIVSAYTAGINEAMQSGKLAAEFRILGYTPEKWTDTDSVAWSKLMAFDLGGNYEDEILGASAVAKLGKGGLDAVVPPYPKDAPTILQNDEIDQSPTAAAKATPSALLKDKTLQALRQNILAARELGMQAVPGKGSNNWVISGKHTKSGKPILADDPHLALTSPMLWYLADMQGDKIKAIGASLPGLPGIVIGRNEKIAWGVTNLGPDVQDLFIEPQDSALETRTEVIKVKGEPDVKISVEESKRGPIINDVSDVGAIGPKVSLAWTALEGNDTTMDSFVGINYASNWNEFVSALSHYVAPSQNFVYADTDGNTGYYAPGKIPIRSGWDGSLPVPADSAHRWTGFIPFEKLPHTFNPADGLIITANNKAVPSNYKEALGPEGIWAEPYRSRRITQLLGQKTSGMTVEDVKKVQLDTVSLVWADISPMLLATKTDDPKLVRALEILRPWDGNESKDSTAATIYEAWLMDLQNMAKDEIGESGRINSLAVINQLSKDGSLCHSSTYKNCQELLLGSLKTAVDKLSARLGDNMDDWQYSKLHIASNKHRAFGDVKLLAKFFNYPVATAGGTNTVNVARPEEDTFAQTHGPSYRQIIDLSDMNNSLFIGSLGQSGSPLSEYAKDQQEKWVKGEYLPMSTNPDDWGKRKVLNLYNTN